MQHNPSPETELTSPATKKTNILEIAKKKRHLSLLEKLHHGKPLTSREYEELKNFEQPSEFNAAPSQGIVNTQAQLGKAVNASVRTIRNWISEGMPVRSDRTYDIAAVEQWRRNRDNRRKNSESEELDNEIRRARLRNLNLENDIEMGRLISREEVDRKNVAKIIAVKRELLALPRSMAKPLENQAARQIESLLKDKILQVIKKFSGQDGSNGKN